MEMIFYMNKFRKIIILCVVTDLIALSGCTPTENNSYTTSLESVFITDTIQTTTEIPVTEPDAQSPDYILNTNTGKFHYPDCPSVELMSEETKLYFTCNKESLLEYGYSSCRKCKP